MSSFNVGGAGQKLGNVQQGSSVGQDVLQALQGMQQGAAVQARSGGGGGTNPVLAARLREEEAQRDHQRTMQRDAAQRAHDVDMANRNAAQSEKMQQAGQSHDIAMQKTNQEFQQGLRRREEFIANRTAALNTRLSELNKREEDAIAAAKNNINADTAEQLRIIAEDRAKIEAELVTHTTGLMTARSGNTNQLGIVTGQIRENFEQFGADRASQEEMIDARLKIAVGDVPTDIAEDVDLRANYADETGGMTATTQRVARSIVSPILWGLAGAPSPSSYATSTGEGNEFETLGSDEEARVFLRDYWKAQGQFEGQRDRVMGSAGSYAFELLQDSEVIPSNISTADRTLVEHFIMGKERDFGDGSNPRKVTIKDLERIQGFDTYAFGHALKSLDQNLLDQRVILGQDRNQEWSGLENEVAISMIDRVRELGLGTRGRELTRGQDSGHFLGVAAALSEQEISSSALENIVRTGISRGMSADEVFADILDLEYQGGVGAGSYKPQTIDPLSDGTLTDAEFYQYLDSFGDIDSALAAIERDRRVADTTQASKTAKVESDAARRLATELDLIRSDQATVDLRDDVIAALERAGTLTAAEEAAIAAGQVPPTIIP